MNRACKYPASLSKKGFALIVTLSLMILLTVIAVGLLTLSSISLRASSSGLETARARANARMALTLALGELQKQTGPDTRVTARADVLNETNPPVLGVWKSWEGTNHTTTGTSAGRPVSPGSDYKKVKEGRFLSWLVSGGSPTNSSAVPDMAAGTGKATLVGEGSVGKGAGRDELQIHLTPSLVTTGIGKGSLAWWVGGENQKARLPKPYKPANDTVAGWSVHSKSHSTADPKVFRMDSLLADATPADKAISLYQSDLIAAKQGGLSASTEFFHDLSATSVGLLTNTATGGWRKDFSLLTEFWSSLPKSNLPLFRLTSEKSTAQAIPTSSSYRPNNSLFYPWAAYRGTDGDPPIYQHGAVSSWANLQNWATLYKEMPASTTSASLPPSTSVSRSVSIAASTPANKFRFLHQVRAIPVIARIQWVFSHWGAPGGANGTRQPAVLVTPVITLWNPYNVAIRTTPMEFFFPGCLPNAFRYRYGTTTNTKWNTFGTATNPDTTSFGSIPLLKINESSYNLQPGETRIFSPASTTPVERPGDIALAPGVRITGGYYYKLLDNNGNPVTAAVATSVRPEVRFNSTYNDAGALGVSIYVDMSFPGSTEELDKRHLVYRMIYEPALAEKLYKPKTLDSVSPSSTPQPFLTTIFGARTASNTHLAANGVTQTSPLVNYTAMGRKDSVERTISFDYPGTAHPVNSPFDYSFEALSAAGSPYLPNASGNKGFIITGFQSADGLSRCVLAEIPTRPVCSLGELQNWDMRYENPIPPYGLNHIGNSSATPLLPSDKVFIPGNSSKGAEDLQYDDSYCSNHLLFDDWFVSSIAPNPEKLGRPASSETLEKTYTDLLKQVSPLPNRAYRPISEDVAAANAGNTTGLLKNVNQNSKLPGSWQTIASRLEVEGMFNVNSTSIKAWRALLGHARNQKVPFLGNGYAVSLSNEQNHVMSRFSVAGDADAASAGFSGLFAEAAQFAGYRTLDEPALDLLAKEVVKQVRLRGPFLSLAEFVNRQLTSGDLALAGTLQAALDALAADSSLNPFKELQALSKPVDATVINDPTTGYNFKESAKGYNAYGLPGWTRQADVLRPIAPILSARDDTFTIRAYGDARDASGKITARATCEATVRRTRDFVDPSDLPEITTLPKAAANLTFGRRYQILAFRWLTESEI